MPLHSTDDSLLDRALPAAQFREVHATSAAAPGARGNRFLERGVETLIRVHIVPGLGEIRLAHLTPADVQAFYAERQMHKLSAKTVRQIHASLHRAVGQAVRQNILARNVVDLVDAPRAARYDMQTLTSEEARALLAAASDDRLESLYVLAVATGMREGELFGLRWRDVDLDRAALSVRQTVARSHKGAFEFAEPKTAKSRRQISLAQSAIAALRSHRLRQNAERLSVGPEWAKLDLVFTNELGRPLSPTNLYRDSFRPLLKRAHLPQIRFHDLRHTAATLLLARNIHPKVVNEMLGHATVAITSTSTAMSPRPCRRRPRPPLTRF